MKWILAILSGLALQAGAITNGVFATKSPYVVEAATMPFDLWTNTVLWLTAESPVPNSGTTNANWICYAKTCAGNSTQTVVNSQPITIVTNGVKALYFDGVDDVIYSPDTWVDGTNDFTFFISFTINTTNGTTPIARNKSATERSAYILINTAASDGRLAFITYDGTSRQSYTPINTILPNILYRVAVAKSGTNAVAYINGAARSWQAIVVASNLTAGTALLSVGGRQDGASDFSGIIYDAKVFNRALKTNELAEITR